MKKILLALILATGSALAYDTSMWLGMDIGPSFIKNNYQENPQNGIYLGGKGLVSWNIDNWILDAGLGIGHHRFSSTYDHNVYEKSDFSSTYGYMTASPRLKLNDRFSLGIEGNYALFNSMLTGVEEQQNLSAGVILGYELKLNEKYDGRVNVSIQRGFQEKSAQTLVLSLQVGMDGQFGVAPRPEMPKVIYVPKPDPKKLYGPFDELDLYNHDDILHATPEI